MPILSRSFERYTVGDYTIENNDWSRGSLIINQDYTQQISFNTNSLQNNVTMTWSYPNFASRNYVYGYPEIIWGNKLGYAGTMAYSNQIANIENLLVDYSVAIGGDTSQFAVSIEIWTSNLPWTSPGAVKTNEIMVKVHGWQDGPGVIYSDETLTAIQSVHYNWGGGYNFGSPWTFVTHDTETDKLTGTISFSNILYDLVAKGVISGTDYVSGVEIGAEQHKGSGSLQVNHFAVTENLGSLSNANLKHSFLGSGANDSLKGLGRQDKFTGGPGNDAIDGGSGLDISVYSGVRRDYALSNSANGRVVTDRIAGRDGSDTLIGIERLQFTDGILAFDNLRTDTAGKGYLLYRAAFDRVPDVAGLGYWIRELDRGQDFGSVVAASFIASPEFARKYGTSLSNAQYVDQLYQNVLHRAGEAAGVAYWNAELNAGGSRSSMLASFAISDENYTAVTPLMTDGIFFA